MAGLVRRWARAAVPGRRSGARGVARHACAGLLVAAAAVQAAWAYPERAVVLVVPSSPASTAASLARALSHALTGQLAQPVVVDARPGAGGTVAAALVARAVPDGHTILLATHATHGANEHLYRKLPYDPVGDFTPITTIARGPQVLFVGEGSPVGSVADLIARARRDSGGLTIGSEGPSARLAADLLLQVARIDLVHVPYRVNADLLVDLAAGRIDLAMSDPSTGAPLVAAGRLRALAVTGRARSPAAPWVPTFAEAGLASLDLTSWHGVHAPAGTPAGVVAQLNAVLHRAARSQTVGALLKAAGMELFVGSPEDLLRHQSAESLKWGRIIEEARMRAE